MSSPTRSSTSRAQSSRRGLTVLEVLVSAALAMIVILAMVEIFSRASAQIRNARAALQMSGQLRNVANRLRHDLAGLTVSVRPWTSPADGAGYFVYVDGWGRDDDPNGDGTKEAQIDADGNGAFDAFEGKDNVDLSYGDFDDILMFTARNENEPFVGRYLNPGDPTDPTDDFLDVITSQYAEVVWWTDYIDRSGNRFWDAGEPVNVHRRTLLIRPDLNAYDETEVEHPWAILRSTSEYEVYSFINRNDISVQILRDSTGDLVGLRANTLEDLTRRENRFAHHGHNLVVSPDPVVPANVAPAFNPFPHRLSLITLRRYRLRDEYNPVPAPPAESIVLRQGEDIVLSNTLAFDVKAFDPLAKVRTETGGIAAVDPGDTGHTQGTHVGSGAFVDLGYRFFTNTAAAFRNNLIQGNLNPESIFSGTPTLRSQLYTRNDNDLLKIADTDIEQTIRNVPGGTHGDPIFMYDTWSAHYEYDGIDQEDAAVGSAWSLPQLGIIDQGTNNIDDPATSGGTPVNGTDDPSERETSPPYPIPMRGLQVTIRAIEVDTKQVRQTSVVANLIKQ